MKQKPKKVCCSQSGYKNAPEIINPKKENFTEELHFHSSQAERDLKLYQRNNCFLTFFEEDDKGKVFASKKAKFWFSKRSHISGPARIL